MNRIISFISAYIVLCLVACTSGHNSYSAYATLPESGWPYTDTLTFIPMDIDSVVTGELMVGLRHSAAYPYSNLWLELTYHPDSVTAVRDTLCIELCDRFGRWYGTGLGASFQIADTLPVPVTIGRGMPVSLRHIMRVDTVAGIEQAGIIFNPFSK